MMGCPPIPLSQTSPFARGAEVEEVEVTRVVVTLIIPAHTEGGERKRMDFLVRSKSLNLVARKDILMMWPTPLGSGPTVSPTIVIIMRTPTSCPLMGDTSDVFDWTWSVTPGGTQDLSMLLQMLWEHYCGSYTFREQKNMVENLPQGVHEDATDFMIRVGTSVSNLGKDWKDQLMEEELQSLQYEVSLNGVREEIRHVLDSKIARHSQLTPHQMYEVVKKYETYIACNKRLEGKSASPHTNHQRAVAQTSGYKPHFHKSTAFAASVEETTDPALSESGPSLPEDEDHLEVEPTREDDEGLFIPSFLEEALGGDGNLQIKMARTMQAQEKHDRRCFICQSLDHLMRDHYQGKNGKGPLQPKGPPQNKSARKMAKASPPSQATSQGAPPK